MHGLQLAQRYAAALFTLSEQKGSTDRVCDELKMLCRSMKEIPKVTEVFLDRTLPTEPKRQAVHQAFAANLSPLTSEFLDLLIDKKRELLLPEITGRFEAQVKEKNGILDVDVMSAMTMSRDEEERLGQRLSRLYRKKVRLSVRADARLLAGLVLQKGNDLIDGSCRGMLDRLRMEMLTH